MASSLWHTGKPGGSVCWGIMGGVNKIPVNFTYSTLMVFDGGINKVSSYMGLGTRKPVFGGLQKTKAQTSLRIRAV